MFVIVKSETYNEIIRYLHCDIVYPDILLICFRLEKQGADPGLGSSLFFKDLLQLNNSIA